MCVCVCVCVCVLCVCAGTVKYIGKLEFDFMDLLYVGIQLDSPGKLNFIR